GGHLPHLRPGCQKNDLLGRGLLIQRPQINIEREKKAAARDLAAAFGFSMQKGSGPFFDPQPLRAPGGTLAAERNGLAGKAGQTMVGIWGTPRRTGPPPTVKTISCPISPASSEPPYGSPLRKQQRTPPGLPGTDGLKDHQTHFFDRVLRFEKSCRMPACFPPSSGGIPPYQFGTARPDRYPPHTALLRWMT